MFFQGHIENGMVVFDEPISLRPGTVVRVEPVAAPRDETAANESVVADTDLPYTYQQMAQAWQTISKPIPEAEVRLSIDPDDYPLF